MKTAVDENDFDLVHVVDTTHNDEVLLDKDFDINAVNSYRLTRTCEMY